MSTPENEQNDLLKASPAHAELQRKAGDWTVRCTYVMGGETDPIEVDGVEHG